MGPALVGTRSSLHIYYSCYLGGFLLVDFLIMGADISVFFLTCSWDSFFSFLLSCRALISGLLPYLKLILLECHLWEACSLLKRKERRSGSRESGGRGNCGWHGLYERRIYFQQTKKEKRTSLFHYNRVICEVMTMSVRLTYTLQNLSIYQHIPITAYSL